MSETTGTPELAPVSAPAHRHEYQPTDEHGRALGGKQVILYTTPDELATKLTEQNVLLIRKLREEGRKRRLGIDDEIPVAQEKMKPVLEFKGRDLTPDEAFALSKDLNDPEKMVTARDLLIETAIGVKPAQLREFLQQQQVFEVQQRAVEQYADFAYATPAYHDCADNRVILTDWMFKKGLAPTVANYQYASSQLQEAGLLLAAPEQQPPVAAPVAAPVLESQGPAAEPPRIGTEQPPQPTRQSHIPSGLNDSNSSTSTELGPIQASGALREDGTLLTLRDINRMPSDEIRRRMKDPAFNALVEKLEIEQRQKKAALGLQKF
jgi:hypothetical protein